MADHRDAERRDAPDHATAGTNARPLKDTISQTAGGLPDDSAEPVEVDPETEKRMAEKLKRM